MRTLANIALSFAAGILLCCYLPEGMWRLWAAGALALAGLGLAAWKKCLAARPKGTQARSSACSFRSARRSSISRGGGS